jgi:hypothetical protein
MPQFRRSGRNAHSDEIHTCRYPTVRAFPPNSRECNPPCSSTGTMLLARVLASTASQSRLSLRGGGRIFQEWKPPDGGEAPEVDEVPPRPPTPDVDSLIADQVNEEVDDLIDKCIDALNNFDPDEAERLHEKAVEHATGYGGLALRIALFRKLENEIAEQRQYLIDKERLYQESLLPGKYWNVSHILNLTKPQVDTLEGWLGGRRLDPSRALYVASRDGWSTRKFHDLCDGKGPTITLVRTETGHIFGGYTSVSWSKGSFKMRPPRWDENMVDDKDAFVFRVASPQNWTYRNWEDVFNMSFSQVFEPFFDKPAKADIEAAQVATGYNGPDVLHYDYWRGQAYIGQTVDGRRFVTAYDEETEMARKAAVEGRPFQTMAQRMRMKEHNEEAEALRKDFEHVWGEEKKVEKDDMDPPMFMTDEGDFDDEFSDMPSRRKSRIKASADAAAVQYGQRWGLDVKVPGIRNQTSMPWSSRTMTDDDTPHQDQPKEAETKAKEFNEKYDGGEFVKCEYSGLNLDIPRLRHVWCMGPTWTHALELDLDNTRNCFSDLLSGALFHMPEGVSSSMERVLLAGKIGGRTHDEKQKPEALWDVEEVAVISV